MRPRPRSRPGLAQRAAVAAAVVLVAAGCLPKKAPPPDLSLDPVQLLAQVRAAQARVTSVQGNARVRVASKRFSGTVGQFVAAQKPDRVHLETLDFFGNLAAVMVADGRRFALYDAREKVVYVGAPTPANLARVLPVSITAQDLVTILCGSVPLAPGVPAKADPGSGVVALRIDAGAVAQILDVGPGAGVVASRTVAPDGAAEPGAVQLAFGNRVPADGIPFPERARLSVPDRRVRVELEWKSPQVNRAVDPALFRLEPPRGARIVDLGEGSTPSAGAPPPLLERPDGRPDRE